MKSLLITASKIAKSFQTFPDISMGIGRWHQSDHKYSGLSAATTGYYQTTMDQGAFMDKIVKMTERFFKIFVKSCFFGILFVTYMRGKIR